jgi:YVTN family beta-propeller protein
MTSLKKTLGLACAAAVLIALITGCNDTLRQFITPIPGPGGDASSLSHAIVLSTNPLSGAVGSNLHIDVAGDTVAGVVNTGPNPQFLGKAGSRVFVLNGDNTISSYIGLLPLIGNPSVVTEPTTTPPISGSISGGTSSTGNFYVTNHGSDNASMVSNAFNSITEVLSVGTNPVAIAGNIANSKIYVVNNNASGTVTPVSTTDNTVLPAIPVGSNPIWAVMSADGVHVFVVNQGSSTVSVIDTLLDIVIATVPVQVSPNYAVYDSKLKRVYVSNTGSNSVSVIDASRIDLAAQPQQLLPTNIANIKVAGSPTSITALPDGTKVYAALGNCPAGINQLSIIAAATAKTCTGNSVSVIDTLSLSEKKVIPAGAGTISIDAANNSSRVYVVNANDATVSIIKTASDTVSSTLPAPQQSLGCVNPAACPQNVKQIPFQVRVFP